MIKMQDKMQYRDSIWNDDDTPDVYPVIDNDQFRSDIPPDISPGHFEIFEEMMKNHGKAGLLRLVRILDIIEEIEIKRDDRDTTKKI